MLGFYPISSAPLASYIQASEVVSPSTIVSRLAAAASYVHLSTACTYVNIEAAASSAHLSSATEAAHINASVDYYDVVV